MQWENKRELFSQFSRMLYVMGKETGFICPIQSLALYNGKIKGIYFLNKATCSLQWKSKLDLFQSSSLHTSRNTKKASIICWFFLIPYP